MEHNGIHIHVPASKDAKVKGTLNVDFEESEDSLDVHVEIKGIANRHVLLKVMSNIGQSLQMDMEEWVLCMLTALSKEGEDDNE